LKKRQLNLNAYIFLLSDNIDAIFRAVMEAAWSSETLVLSQHYTTSQPRKPRFDIISVSCRSNPDFPSMRQYLPVIPASISHFKVRGE